ncbi:MAG: hypothetical protein WBQ29_20035 [Isosphaeraceae bacterium]|jgi:hypothetical protein
MRSVTEMIRPFADAKQQFTNVQDGWSQFLHYLRDRNGADIHGTRKLEEIDIALEYVDDNSENLEARRDDPRTAWFDDFSRREDVVEACYQFLKHRGLPLS